MDKKMTENIQAIVDYLYEDEERHYEEYEDKPKDHIYLKVKRVNEWLDSCNNVEKCSEDGQKMTNIKDIKIGEIITIKNREWIMTETTHKNGRMEWEQPTLVLLSHVIKGINKKPYYKKNNIIVEPLPTKIIRGKSLSNIKRKKK